MDFTIWIVTPPAYPHSRCFEEVALALRESLTELGHNAQIATDPAEARGQAIALGANLLRPGMNIPENCILYNLEQISPGSPWLTSNYVDLLRRHRTWDYSKSNAEILANYGIQSVLCEIGYTAGLTRIETAPSQDIDVVLIGTPNKRRNYILKSLRDRGKRAIGRFNVYGAERDIYYANTKIALNVHFYETKVFEIVRCSYLLANTICVVSEIGSEIAVEDQYRDGVAFCTYDGLVERCLDLLNDDKSRTALAENGFRIFSARPQRRFLQSALAETGIG